MKNRCLALVMALLLMLCAGCSVEAKPMLEQHLTTLAAEMQQLATEAYFTAYGVSERHWRDSDLMQMKWRKPVRDVYLYTVNDTDISQAVLGLLDDEGLMWTTALRNSIVYVDESQKDVSMMFVRFFSDGEPMLFRVAARGGVVTISCLVLVDNGEPPLRECRSAQDVIFWLGRYGYSGVYASSDPANVPDTGKRLPGGSLVRNARVLAGCDYCKGEPRLILQCDLTFDNLAAAYEDMEAARGNEVAMRRLEDEAAARTLVTYAGWHGLEALMAAVSDQHGGGGSYANPYQPDGAGAIVFFYEGCERVTQVSWNARGGAVTMNAGCLCIPQIADCQSAEELNAIMAEVGLPYVFREVR